MLSEVHFEGVAVATGEPCSCDTRRRTEVLLQLMLLFGETLFAVYFLRLFFIRITLDRFIFITSRLTCKGLNGKFKERCDVVRSVLLHLMAQSLRQSIYFHSVETCEGGGMCILSDIYVHLM